MRLARLSLRLASRPERESISNPNLFAAAIRQTIQLFSVDLGTAILCEQEIVKYWLDLNCIIRELREFSPTWHVTACRGRALTASAKN